jgi:hypothetical protein
MVRQLCYVLWLALVGEACAAQLTARLDAQESRLGEAVLLQVEARGKQPSLEGLELAPLAADFEVSNVTRSSETDRARLEATLYPLRAGVLTVPAFTAHGSRSKPLALTVREDPELSVTARFAPEVIHERQHSILLITVRDKADRQWTLPARLEAPGLLLRPLGERQFEEGAGPDRVSVRELRWAVLGLKAGHRALTPPPLDGYQLGRRLRMPLPTAPLEVRPLPAYLPVSVPVGKPGFAVAPLPKQAQVGSALLWVLRIASPGFTPDAARALLRLPEGGQGGVRFYPASFHQEQSEQGLSVLRVEIPMLFTRAGTARLPGLSLPYFDPATQRMEALRLGATDIEVDDPFWRRAAGVAAVAALLFATGFLLYRGRVLWERRQARRAALQQVAQAATTGTLLRAVCDYAAAPRPATLRQWLDRHPSRPDLRMLVDEMEAAHFGTPANADLAAIRQRWLAALRSLRLT